MPKSERTVSARPGDLLLLQHLSRQNSRQEVLGQRCGRQSFQVVSAAVCQFEQLRAYFRLSLQKFKGSASVGCFDACSLGFPTNLVRVRTVRLDQSCPMSLGLSNRDC